MSYDESREQEKKTDRKVEEPAVDLLTFTLGLYYTTRQRFVKGG